MKAHLLFRNRDLDPQAPLPWGSDALFQDLELETLYGAMAQGDAFIFETVKHVTLTACENDLDTIHYRQDILRDCLRHPEVVRELYAIAVEAVVREKKHYLGTLTHYPDWVLRWSVEVMETLFDVIDKLRKVVDRHADKFVSEGWVELFGTLKRELTDEYRAAVRSHLRQLKFRHGVMLGARLGKGNVGTGYSLHLPPVRKGSWLTRLFQAQPPAFGFTLHPRDESGGRMLGELQNRGIAIAATALGQSAEHVRSFFAMLRTELAFYVGCLNLRDRLAATDEPFCLSTAAPFGEGRLSFLGLYDICLALKMPGRVVGNDADADGKRIVIVTGANQGGKSTFLRSVGLAQLMMQSGMFVPARSLHASLCKGILTHYKREEDSGMTSGKLDEELRRMSDILDHLEPGSMILFNESFAATNEREGSEIAWQIVSALAERPLRLLFVTHLYEFAKTVQRNSGGQTLFLRADRRADGTRSFKLREGEPLATSFGEDLYDNVFGPAAADRERGPAASSIETAR